MSLSPGLTSRLLLDMFGRIPVAQGGYTLSPGPIVLDNRASIKYELLLPQTRPPKISPNPPKVPHPCGSLWAHGVLGSGALGSAAGLAYNLGRSISAAPAELAEAAEIGGTEGGILSLEVGAGLWEAGALGVLVGGGAFVAGGLVVVGGAVLVYDLATSGQCGRGS
jgi:hypothetical protein